MPRRLRLPVTIVAALAVAEAAVILFRPRDALEPIDVAPQRYFSTEFVDRAEDFRSGQLVLFGVRLALELGLLVWVVRRPPARLRARFRRPVVAGAATAAALAVVVTIVTLPASAIARQRAKDVGLVTQSWLGWASDVVKGIAIEAVIVGAGGALLVFVMRRLGRRWWVAGAALAVTFGVIVTYASPIVLDPVFNRFEPLRAGELRRDVFELARRADVEVGQVYVMDASRRTTAANAYVAGLGTTKRVVLYDTLLDDFTPEEVRGVVAHELGHVHHHDVPHGLLYLAIVAPFGMLAVARIAERLAPDGLGTPAAVPAVALAIALVVPGITFVSNGLSRAVEARADRFAMELTRDPNGLIGFQRRLTVKNVSDPDPPGWVHALLGTHPTAMERIGQALAFRRSLEGAAAPLRAGS
ncbi:MAG TPA: M48 family metallopeptidase [Solirubrobacteraceae bacterium]|nr:M48 family metallopeptidase [Solirubrobacteraceae bacterium]